MTSLEDLDLSSNSISDLTSLSGLTKLEYLWINSNNISDLAPLVANTGLGARGGVEYIVYVSDNPLSDTSLDTHIPELRRRGVRVLIE